MKSNFKKYLTFILLLIATFISLNKISAYSIYDENNPGSSYGGGGDDLTNSPTKWPNTSFKSARVRIFRGNNVVLQGYLFIASSKDGCYGSAQAKLCTTSGYRYSNVNSINDWTCSNEQTIKFNACIYGNNLDKSWGVDSSNGNYLNNYLSNDNYSNLKNILSSMGYGSSNYNDSDIVIIEPATFVYCAGTPYFGTSTALMGANVSYKGSANNSSNLCKAADNAEYPGSTFRNLFNSMSLALKVSTGSTCGMQSDGTDFYDQCGYFKYNISDFGYIPKYNLTITKKDSSNNKAIGGVKFTLSGNGFADSCTTNYSDGTCTISSILGDSNAYTLTESSPNGYSFDKCDGCDSVSGNTMKVKITGNKSITVYNKKSCTGELEALGSNPTKTQLVNLYKIYKNKGLLNFSNPSCNNNITPNYSEKYSCMYADININNFNENNLSGFEDEITLNNNYTAFCAHTYNFSNVLNITSEYNFGTFKSGQMFLNLNSPKIGEGTIIRTCYVFGNSNSFSNDKTYSSYIGSVSLNDKVLISEIPTETANKSTESGYAILTWTYKTIYNLSPVYSVNGSGKIVYSSCPNCKFLGYGFVSNLDIASGEKTVPFKITESNGNILVNDNSSCRYNIYNEILVGGDLNIEFRSVDVDDPFPGKTGNNRNSGTNWSIVSLDTNGDGIIDNTDYNNLKNSISSLSSKYDINKDGVIDDSDLSIINTYIQFKEDLYATNIFQNTPNSYGIIPKTNERVEPKYVITLIPSTIQDIKSYNLNTTYDDYNLTCREDGGICTSNYLTTLIEKNIVKINSSSKR